MKNIVPKHGPDVSGAGETISIPPGQKWIKVNGVTYVSVTLNGATGLERSKRLSVIRPGRGSDGGLLLRNLKSSQGVTSILGIRNISHCEYQNRTINTVEIDARVRSWSKPTVEHAYLLRELLTGDEMQFLNIKRLYVMHDPVVDREKGRFFDEDGDERYYDHFYSYITYLSRSYGCDVRLTLEDLPMFERFTPFDAFCYLVSEKFAQ
jgi:hypothetical protein